MKTDDLKLCIEVLTTLRKEMHQETNTSVTGRLDMVILALEKCLEPGEQDIEVPIVVRRQTLVAIVDSLHLLTNLSELVRLWMGMS